MDWHHWVHNTQDEDNKKKKQRSTICVGHHHTQDTRRRQTHIKHNTKYVGHNYAQTNTNTVKVKARKK